MQLKKRKILESLLFEVLVVAGSMLNEEKIILENIIKYFQLNKLLFFELMFLNQLSWSNIL